MKTALVTGGTGQIGVYLLPRLLAGGWRVVGLTRRVAPGETRRPEAADGRLEWVHPDTFGASGASDGQQSVEALVSAGPLTLAAGLVTRCQGLECVVCFSSSSVLVKADSRSGWEREQMRLLLDAEDALREACKARSVPLWLFRPTLIYGCGLDRNVSLLAHLAQRFHVLPVAGRAEGLRQPVHAEDLAKLACRALDQEAGQDGTGGLETPVAGGESLPFRTMVSRVLEATGTRPRLIPVPTILLAAGAALVGRLFRMRNLNAELIRRQHRDLAFDDAPARERLGWDPRPFRPEPGDFRVPDDVRALFP